MKSLRRVWAAAQRSQTRSAVCKNLSEAEGRKPQGALARLCGIPMPEATIEIPVQFVRMFSCFREILSVCIRIVIVAYRLLSDSCLWALRTWVTLGISSPTP